MELRSTLRRCLKVLSILVVLLLALGYVVNILPAPVQKSIIEESRQGLEVHVREGASLMREASRALETSRQSPATTAGPPAAPVEPRTLPASEVPRSTASASSTEVREAQVGVMPSTESTAAPVLSSEAPALSTAAPVLSTAAPGTASTNVTLEAQAAEMPTTGSPTELSTTPATEAPTTELPTTSLPSTTLPAEVPSAPAPAPKRRKIPKSVACIGAVGGLGYVPSTGLFNQCISFLGLVVYALEQKHAYLAQDTLNLFSGWNGLENDVAFADLFNVSVWNDMARRHRKLKFPEIAEACHSTKEVPPRKLFQKGYAIYLNRQNPLLCPFWSGLQPVDALLARARKVRPSEAYGVIHARIEDDLRAPGIPAAFWSSRTSLPRLYELLANSTDSCLGEPKAIYMCVMAEDVSEPEDRKILDELSAPWPDARLVLGGSSAAGSGATRLHGALLDFAVAREAPFFIGSARMSTFTRSIMTIRSCLQLGCNLNYEPSGISRAEY